MKNLYIILLFIVVNFFQTWNVIADDTLESIFGNAVKQLLETSNGHSCLVNTNKNTAGQYNTFIHIPGDDSKLPKVFLIRFDQNGSRCDILKIDRNHQCIEISFLKSNSIGDICKKNQAKLEDEFKGFSRPDYSPTLKPLDGTQLFLKAAKEMDNTHIKTIYRNDGYIFLLSTDDSEGISPARLIVQDGSVYDLTETTKGIRQGDIKPAIELIKEKRIRLDKVRSIGLEGRFLTKNMKLYIPNSPKPKYTLIKQSDFETRLKDANDLLPIEDILSIEDWPKIYSGLLILLLDPQYEFPSPDKHLREKYRFFQHLLIYLEK